MKMVDEVNVATCKIVKINKESLPMIKEAPTENAHSDSGVFRANIMRRLHFNSIIISQNTIFLKSRSNLYFHYSFGDQSGGL